MRSTFEVFDDVVDRSSTAVDVNMDRCLFCLEVMTQIADLHAKRSVVDFLVCTISPDARKTAILIGL